jgi:hypothetical protein
VRFPLVLAHRPDAAPAVERVAALIRTVVT